MDNREQIKISIKDNRLDFRVHQQCADYQYLPTIRGFSIPLTNVSKFIESIESVQAYALIEGL